MERQLGTFGSVLILSKLGHHLAVKLVAFATWFSIRRKQSQKRSLEDANYAEVDTKIVTENSRKELSINYKLHSLDNEWKIYDLVIEDVSLFNNYRSQFDRVIAQSSFENLVRVLQEKQAQGFEKLRPLNADMVSG